MDELQLKQQWIEVMAMYSGLGLMFVNHPGFRTSPLPAYYFFAQLFSNFLELLKKKQAKKLFQIEI